MTQKYAVADVSEDGSCTRLWSTAEGADIKSAMQEYAVGLLTRDEGYSGHLAALKKRGTVKFAIAPARKEGFSPKVNICDIRFFEVSLPKVIVTPVGRVDA